jgi:DNA-binding NarL/FixJ family response regulator/antitoxin (DNA-binding transcriptional repressor) of toxin-antitoxin stability system
VSITAERVSRQRRDDTALRRATSLVERDSEIAVLKALLSSCTRGEGTVAVIRGPVASGKTALLRTFAQEATDSGAIFLSAVASRAERGLPLGILNQLFLGNSLPLKIASQVAQLLEKAALAGTVQEPEADIVSPALAHLFNELLKLLAEASAGQPLVIAVDDVQCADVVSLQWLSYFSRRASTSRILAVLTECTSTPSTTQLLHAEILRQGNSHCISLASLSPYGVARLLCQYLDHATAERLAPACHAITGGNPLLVNALGQDCLVSANGPVTDLAPRRAFHTAVATCLHRYGPWMVQLAQAVAILDTSTSTSLVGELLEISHESAARGIEAFGASGLLESGRFRHDAAREAVLDHMTADERAVMQGRAARTLYRAGAAATIIARHLVAAHRIGESWTVPVLREAAERALTDGESIRAISYLRLAENECADESQRASIRFALTRAEWLTDPECAARYLPELVADARQGRLDDECMTELPYYLLWAGDAKNAAEILSMPRLISSSPVPQETGIYSAGIALRSPLDFLCPDLAKPTRHAAQDAQGSSSAPANDGEAALISAERILQERGPKDPALATMTTALLALVCEDRLDRAASWCDLLLQDSGARSGSTVRRAVLTSFLAMIETRRGNLDAAEDHARRALAMLTEKAWGVAIGGPLSCLLLTSIASRKHDEAAACLRMPVPDAMFGTPFGLLYLCARGEYYLATGRPQAALADFSSCGERMVAWGLDLPGLVAWRTKAAEAYLAMGNTQKARELSQEQLVHVGSRPSRTRGISLRVLALSSHQSKRAVLLRESAEALRDSDAQLELAYTLGELSNTYLALGEHGRAQWASRHARNLSERCGVRTPRPAPSTEDLDLDPAQPASGVDTELLSQLSDAERRVATLAACGYTNCQISKRLYITVSTVEQHLTRVYRKLGVTGRAELPIQL